MVKPVKVFLSYSHKDESYKDRLDTFLYPLKRNGEIILWNDRAMVAGDNVDEEISRELKSADIIILLISADFIASTYCYDIEWKAALERHKAKEALAIGIVIKPCGWKKTHFRQYAVLPKDAKALITFSENEKEGAYQEIVEGIEAAIQKFQEHRSCAAADDTNNDSGGIVQANDSDSEEAIPRMPEAGTSDHKASFASMDGSKKRSIKMELPINKQVSIQPDFFDSMCEFTHNLSTFMLRTQRIIAETAKEYAAEKRNCEKSYLPLCNMKTLQIFLQRLCREINLGFFKYDGVRTHFRYLHQTNYIKLAAAHGSDYYKNDMTHIPWINSMIFASSNCRKTLLMSLNPEFHYGKTPDANSRYKDYLTFTFLKDDFCPDRHTLLSMGISFENPNQYKNLIYHLNFCRFEDIIMSIIMDFSVVSKINIVNTILQNQNMN